MNKLTVVSLPLPITSAILGYNLGWISPVAAQEDSLWNRNRKLDDFAIETYLATNELKSPAIKYQLTNLDLSIQNLTNQTEYFLTLKPEFPLVINTTDTINNLNNPNNLDNLYIDNFETTTTLDHVILWRDLDESFLDYSATLLENLELKKLELKLKSVEPLNTTKNIDNLEQIIKSSSVTSQTAIDILDNEQSIQSSPIIEKPYSDIAQAESFLVIDNLNPSYEVDAGQISSTTELASYDNPLNQTLAQIAQYDLQNQQDVAPEPITRVSDLRDVQPTDWAYGALKKLVNRMRCFAGYEDNSFRGDRNISRYEFAAALNACLQKIEEIAIEKLPEYFTEVSLAELEKLTTEFKEELIAIQTKTDNLEDRVAFLEDTNFSPTTILRGEVVMQMANAFGDKKAVPTGESPSEGLDSVVTFGARTRLNFETSFTGRDLLRTRIEAGNLNGYGLSVTGTQMTFLGVSTNTGNNVRLGQIFYRFPLGDKGNAYIAGARQSASTFIPLLNRATTISLFGFNNPLYDLGFGAGGGLYYQFTDLIGAGATYYAGSPNNPEPSKGFFNGDYAALAQVTLTPSDDLGISFTYAHFFTPEPRLTTNLTGFTGSLFAQLPFGLETATASDNFNISLSYQVSDRVELGGWVGYINAVAKSSPTDSGLAAFTGSNANIWTAALTASYNDLGKLGSKLSFILGLPPKLTDNDVPDREDEDTSLHLELSYNYPLTEKISLTPGVLTITSPEHNDKNGAIVIGLFRTTFRF